MNKKFYALFFVLLFISIGISTFATSLNESAVDYSNSIAEKSSTLVEASSNFFGGTSGTGANLTSKWAYLGKEWKDLLIKNPVIGGIDSFFKSINFVFVALFGVDYSLSLAVSFTIILWFYFFFAFHNLLNMGSIFSKWVSLLISLGLIIILAQVGLFSMIVNSIIQLFFGEQTWWMKLIIGVLILLGLVLMFAFIMKFGRQASERKKKQKDEMNRAKLDLGAKISEAMSHAFKKE